MNYEKRLLKELAQGYKHLSASDFASIWKRSKVDVAIAAAELRRKCKIKIGKNGVLSMREGIGYA